MRKQFNLQLFAAPTGTTVTADLEPGISIDILLESVQISMNYKIY